MFRLVEQEQTDFERNENIENVATSELIDAETVNSENSFIEKTAVGATTIDAIQNSASLFTAINACRVCGSKDLKEYIDLGEMPLVNNLSQNKNEPDHRFPLKVNYCAGCSHSQLSGVVDSKLLFSSYVYRSSMSQTFAQHCAKLAEKSVKDLGVTKGSLVIDIASNDGCLLKQFLPYKVRVLGVDPAENLAELATNEGIPTIAAFWTPAVAQYILKEYGPAMLITATNVFAHVHNLSEFIKGVNIALDEKGTFIIEVPYLVDLIKSNIFDTVYHEHLSYCLLDPLVHFFKKQNLIVTHVEHINIHGGTIRLYIQKKGEPDDSVTKMIGEERVQGFHSFDRYREFAYKTHMIRDEFIRLLKNLKAQEKKVAAFGASAKGTILMNFCGITSQEISFVVDDTPEKQGKYIAGVKIPIVDRSYLKNIETKPDYLAVLAWNFFDEIKAKTKEFYESGGKYILPVPFPHIVD